MYKDRIIPWIVAAFFATFAIFSFTVMNSTPPEPAAGNGVHEENGDSGVTNNVENNVNGDKADINNSIKNNLNGSNNNQIENNITNNINVNVDVNVNNNIDNDVDDPNSGNSNGDQEDQEQGNTNKDGTAGGDEVVWGVDSANLTTSELLACVRENFGDPQIWGRYLGEKEGVSVGLTSEEVELLHSNDIQVLVIWNHFTDATGYENGKNEAQQAIAKAEELGIPEGVAIFADIEPNYPVDSEFIRGWYEVMNQSNYASGIYGIFDAEQALYNAFNEAASADQEILENTYLWTAAPNVGITPESEAPEYQPDAPKNALVGGWQYGIDAEECNIDTNLFNADITEVLW